MSDDYIDQEETLGYGSFAVKQITALQTEVAEDLKSTLATAAARIDKATKAMSKALEKAGDLPKTTFTGSAQDEDPVGAARESFRKLIKYAESRTGGAAIAKDILGRETLTTIRRRRPAKLVHALDTALRAIEKHKAKLEEHVKWTAEITAARDAVTSLDTAVRATRQQRRAMTPEVAAARKEWLAVYIAAKLLVEGVLRFHDKHTDRMSDIFDDLAEVQRVPGVTVNKAGDGAGDDGGDGDGTGESGSDGAKDGDGKGKDPPA